MPQSRLDAYPLYVLCRELLRKVMLREIEYQDARNVALSDLVAEMRRAVAAAEAAVATAADNKQAALATAEARRNAEADRADAERERLEDALGAAKEEALELREQVAAAEAARVEATAEAKRQEYRADKFEKDGEKAAEDSGARIQSLESILSDATQLRNAFRRSATDGVDEVTKRKMFLEGAVRLAACCLLLDSCCLVFAACVLLLAACYLRLPNDQLVSLCCNNLLYH